MDGGNLMKKLISLFGLSLLLFSATATAQVSEDVLAVEDVELVESIRYVFGTMP